MNKELTVDEVMELAYRLLHEFAWTSEEQSKNEFYYKLVERVGERSEDNKNDNSSI